jgi:exonuclease III
MKISTILVIVGLPAAFLLSDFHRTFSSDKYSENRANLDSIKIKSQFVTFLFWNVENLYDPLNDTVTIDEEFTPEGMKRWTWTKFYKKINHVAKTVLSAGKFEVPAIIGLCEIENRYVLNVLVSRSPLVKQGYRIVQYDSPDSRGVDVALLYDPKKFELTGSHPIRIRFPSDTLAQTREILMVKGLLNRKDTIYVFVNHWPSRRGGQIQSEPRRIQVASTLRKAVDSIFNFNKNANIIITGDFNDEPEDESLKTTLQAQTTRENNTPSGLYNLMGIRNRTQPEGTLKFRDQWSTFDQFIVSAALLEGTSGLLAGTEQVTVCKESFLFEEDKTYFGQKLKRTYAGPRYVGGFSDHLPILLKIEILQ